MTETDDALKANKLRLTKKRLFFMKQADLNPGAVGAEWLKDGVQAIDLLQRAITKQAAQIERLTRERDEAIREMSGWATKAGEAEGRLKASEWHGVIEGWKDRATTAERERDEARAEVERFRSERSYIVGFNDGFEEAKAQHRAILDETEAHLSKVFRSSGCTLFLDGRNEHGSHVIMSYPTNMPDLPQDDVDEYAEEILVAAEKLGFVVGEDHVWAEWRWEEPQIGDEGRVEFQGYWEFVRIDEELTRAALTKGGENGQS